MLDDGYVTLRGSSLTLKLVRSSGVAAALSPVADPSVDYSPTDRLGARSGDTFYHLGDLDLRLRTGDSDTWHDYSTAFRRAPVKLLSSDTMTVAQDLAPALPSDIPLRVVRTWSVAEHMLTLRFTLTNRSSAPVHIGGFGMPLVFNNIFTGRTLDQTYGACSFYDPYIGDDAGYVQVVRLTGSGPVLLLLPYGRTPLEAWKPILDKRSPVTGKGLLFNDPTRRGATFEGSFDWMVRSAGFTTREWKGVDEWNPGTETVLAPGQSVVWGLRFVVAPGLRKIDDTLTRNRRPVAIGIPSYILPEDIKARLFLRYDKPVHSITVDPAGAVSIHDDGTNAAGYHAYTLRGVKWGRSRLSITYEDGLVQTIAYSTIKPEAQAVADLGRFLYHQQWFSDANDPFHREPSIISYDDSVHQPVTQDYRVWIAGLSDEGGAGSWLAGAMKEFVAPDREEISKFETFVDNTLWGHLQISSGPHQYGVRKSLFYYQPSAFAPGFYNPKIEWNANESWTPQQAARTDRSYDYPHVVAAYWSLYRVARTSDGLVTHHPWQWYLNQAYETTLAMEAQAPYLAQFGQMEGTVFVQLLNDLKREGWTEQAGKVEAEMRARAEAWRAKAYPFGSEMPWDSTGQEEVYDWTRYFGFDRKAEVTLNAILAYTPLVPNWGYNGSARRYWDFLYAGKIARLERQLHHYGSGLNAIPLLAQYRLHPADLYLLRDGYGGLMGPLANINRQGFASAAFHSFPDMMADDPYSGDYGPNFFGFAINTGTYLTHDAALGWLAFGGNVSRSGSLLHLIPLDGLRQRVFLAPAGLWLTLDAGRFASVDYDPAHGTARLRLDAGTNAVHTALLRISQPAGAAHSYTIAKAYRQERGARVVTLGSHETEFRLANIR